MQMREPTDDTEYMAHERCTDSQHCDYDWQCVCAAAAASFRYKIVHEQ